MLAKAAPQDPSGPLLVLSSVCASSPLGRVPSPRRSPSALLGAHAQRPAVCLGQKSRQRTSWQEGPDLPCGCERDIVSPSPAPLGFEPLALVILPSPFLFISAPSFFEAYTGTGFLRPEESSCSQSFLGTGVLMFWNVELRGDRFLWLARQGTSSPWSLSSPSLSSPFFAVSLYREPSAYLPAVAIPLALSL